MRLRRRLVTVALNNSYVKQLAECPKGRLVRREASSRIVSRRKKERSGSSSSRRRRQIGIIRLFGGMGGK